MNNGTGLSADNSVIKVVDSGFQGQYEAIIVTNTNLLVERCRLEGCDFGIVGAVDTASGNGTASILNTSILSSETCIMLRNLTVSVVGCGLTGRVPLMIYPPAWLSRENCTMEAFAQVRGNTFWVSAYYSGTGQAGAVSLFSAIPIEGIERMVQNDSWTAEVPVARYMCLKWPGFRDDPTTHLYCNSTGTEALFDHSMKKLGEGRFDDGWVEVFERGHNDPFHDWYLGPPLDFSHRLRAELIQSMGSLYVWRRMDEGALEFWLEKGSSISWGTIDARTLLCPHDV